MNLKEIALDPIHDSQKLFRQLLDCMSRPTSIQYLEADLQVPKPLLLATALSAFSLFDQQVSFYHSLGERIISEYLTQNTGAMETKPSIADFVILDGSIYAVDLTLLKQGSPEYPDESASIFLQVERLSKTPLGASWEITATGPGINASDKLYVQGLKENYLEVLSDINSTYPQGIDLYLSSSENSICGIPRSIQLSWNWIT